MNKRHKNQQNGFTILVAVVTAGILLIIAMSIGGIALKEQILSTANKESQVAFYAADTGMECALYWDQKQGAFAPDIAGGSFISQTKTPTISCNNMTLSSLTPDVSDINHYSYKFMVSGIGGTTACSVVKISKDTISIPNKTKTEILSYGYNTCDASLNRLERGITTTY
jgi:hypothetical protein